MNLADHGFKWRLLFKIPLGFRLPGGLQGFLHLLEGVHGSDRIDR